MTHKGKMAMFRRGAEATARYRKGDASLYFCPLCMVGFPESSLKDDTLTVEHVPPKSVGGKVLVLTCKDCNSGTGHSIDAAQAGREELREIVAALLQGSPTTGPKRVQLEIGGTPLNVELSKLNDTVTLEIAEEANHPDRSAQVKAYMQRLTAENRTDREEFHIEVRRKNPRRLAKIGDLKNGFLAAFAAFGYRFAFDPRLDVVREQIRAPDTERLGPRFWLPPPEVHDWERGIVIAHEPLSAVWVWIGNSMVIMPWLDSPVNFYESLTAGFSEGQILTVSGSLIPWPTRMKLVLDFLRLE